MVSNRNPKPSKDEQLARVARAREALAKGRSNRAPRQPPASNSKRSPQTAVVDSADSAESTIAVRYEMELAAHRETTDRLLAEKDRHIAVLEALVAELRERSGREV